MKRLVTISLLIPATIALALVACEKGSTPEELRAYALTQSEFGDVLASAARIGQQRYIALDGTLHQLKQHSEAFCQTPSASGLKKAQSAWRQAVSQYAQVESIAIGPLSQADSEGLTPKLRLKNWPVQGRNNKVEAAIDSLVSGGESGETISAQSIAGKPTQYQSLDAIEYLLFGDGSRSVDCFDGTITSGACDIQRSCEVLKATTSHLAQVGATVKQAWVNHYSDNLLLAGGEGSEFLDQPTALSEVVNGMNSHLMTIRDKKLRDPINAGFAVADPSALEAWRAQQSLELIRHNIEAIEALYNGGQGAGLDDLFQASEQQQEDREFQRLIQLTLSNVEALSQSLSDQLAGASPDKAPVKTLHDSVAQLAKHFDLNILGKLPVARSFNENDGD